MGALFSHPTVTGVPLRYAIADDAIDIELVGARGALGTFRIVKRGAWKAVKQQLENHVAFNAHAESLPEYFNRHPCKLTLEYAYGTGVAFHGSALDFLEGRNFVLNVTTLADNKVYAIHMPK